MIIEVARIPPEGMRFVGKEPPSILDMQDEEDLRAEEPVRYDLEARVVSNELIVKGTLSVDMSFRCSKCGEFSSLPVSEPSFQCVHEVVERNQSVDLTADISQAIILTFPNYPVCKPDCKGLCPQCGANLNKDSCDCKPPEDFRWCALDDLSVK